MDNAKERRRYIRTEIPIPLVIRLKQGDAVEEIETQAKNISATGIMVETPKKMPAGTAVELSISPKGISSPIHIKATVIRSDKEKGQDIFNTGIEFNKIEEDNKNTFLKFLCDIIYKI